MNITLFCRGKIWHANFSYRGRQYRRSCKTERRSTARTRAARIATEITSRPFAQKVQLTPPQKAVPDWDDMIEKALRWKASWLMLMYRRALDRARKRNVPFALTSSDMGFLARRSGGRCEVSGIEFHWAKTETAIAPFAPALDRIVPSKGYTTGNVRLVCNCVNAAMGAWGDTVFWTMIEKANEAIAG